MAKPPYVAVYLHLIWATQRRRPLLHESFTAELFGHLRDQAAQKGIEIDHLVASEDHLHCVVALSSRLSVNQTVRELKLISARWINERPQVKTKFRWQADYHAFSVSPEQLTDLRGYLDNAYDRFPDLPYDEEVRWLRDSSQHLSATLDP